MNDDVKWMKKALRLAEKGLGTTSPNPMVGAVIVKDGRILGQGWHVRAGEGMRKSTRSAARQAET